MLDEVIHDIVVTIDEALVRAREYQGTMATKYPQGGPRALTLAITKLEEAQLWAKRSVGAA